MRVFSVRAELQTCTDSATPRLSTMGVDHGGTGRYKSPQNLELGGLSPQILSCC